MTNHTPTTIEAAREIIASLKEKGLREIKEAEAAAAAAQKYVKELKKKHAEDFGAMQKDVASGVKTFSEEGESTPEAPKPKRNRRSFSTLTDEEIKEKLSALFEKNAKLKTAEILEGIDISPVRFTKFVQDNSEFIGSAGARRTFVYVKK